MGARHVRTLPAETKHIAPASGSQNRFARLSPWVRRRAGADLVGSDGCFGTDSPGDRPYGPARAGAGGGGKPGCGAGRTLSCPRVGLGGWRPPRCHRPVPPLGMDDRVPVPAAVRSRLPLPSGADLRAGGGAGRAHVCPFTRRMLDTTLDTTLAGWSPYTPSGSDDGGSSSRRTTRRRRRHVFPAMVRGRSVP